MDYQSVKNMKKISLFFAPFSEYKRKRKNPLLKEKIGVFIMQIYRQFSQTLPMHKNFVRNYFSSSLMIFNRYMASFTANISTAEDNI